MKALLNAVALPSNNFGRLILFSLFSLLLSLAIALYFLLYSLLSVHILAFTLVLWLLWFFWQGFFFYRNRNRYLQKTSRIAAYKRAFYRDILLGVSCGVGLMLWPFFYGLLSGSPLRLGAWNMAPALFLIILGIGTMVHAFGVIGFTRAGFFYEFTADLFPDTEVFIRRGIYRFMDHPLFFGGVTASLGSSILYGQESLLLGLLNVGILPIYTILEDRRQEKIWGIIHAQYRNSPTKQALGTFAKKD